jgi:anthranilate/para-aminobenzoate synthase component II
MFCERLEIQVSGKTERPIKFISWKHKEPAWKQIESQVLELGKTRLHHQVRGKDLFAVEAQFHPECQMSSQNTTIISGQRNEKKTTNWTL